ncbi:hypothetical protein THICB2_790003 [Thiomonas sp. CB2]|nr:hypothetical protein THICB2_790003 [Thiomonas sp. CB2]
MPSRIGVGHGRNEHRCCVGAHVQAVGDQGEGAEVQATDDLNHHHDAAQGDHPPGFVCVSVVALAQENMLVVWYGKLWNGVHLK